MCRPVSPVRKANISLSTRPKKNPNKSATPRCSRFPYTYLTRPEDVYVFIPALRRAQRLSPSARCSPDLGTDETPTIAALASTPNLTHVRADCIRAASRFSRSSTIPCRQAAFPITMICRLAGRGPVGEVALRERLRRQCYQPKQLSESLFRSDESFMSTRLRMRRYGKIPLCIRI